MGWKWEGGGKEEWEGRWQTSRPAYMREAEPLAHPDAWPSVHPAAQLDPADQALNRFLFREGRNRKQTLPAERKAAGSEPVVKSGEEQKKAG